MKRILITPGEPAGIGPDITLALAKQAWDAELIVVADPDLLRQRATQLGLSLGFTEYQEKGGERACSRAGELTILPIKLKAKAESGKLNADNAPYVIHTLEAAAGLAKEKKADAIVTGPVHKAVLGEAGAAFTGHTEFFATYCHVPHTVMLFVVDQLKVALATTHLPLAKVPAAITRDRLHAVLSILRRELQCKFALPSPRIAVCGLNPHAGEGGHFGREEIDVITPVLDQLRQQSYSLEGPLPADTIFTAERLRGTDAVLAMYHDQALPLVKYLGFGHAVNTTLGLPFVRTSVDHGTALDLAGTGRADPGSLFAAVRLAISLVRADNDRPSRRGITL